VVIDIAMPIGRYTTGQPWGQFQEKSMMIMLRAAIAAFSLALALGSAYAGDGDGNSATTLFTSIENRQVAPARNVAAPTPTIAARNGGAAIQAPDSRSQGQGMRLFRVFSLP
jgi:hypothetical protein